MLKVAASASKFLADVFTNYERKCASKKLAALGLLLEDTYASTPDVMLAVSRLPADVRKARDQRILRALDLSLKHEELPVQYQPADPLEIYLQPYLDKVHEEKDTLEAYNHY